MANAKKCDRCGGYFDPLRIDHLMCRFRNPVFQSKTDVAENKVGSYLLQHEPPDAMVDLCPGCAEDFELFMDYTPLAIYNDPPMCEKDLDKTQEQIEKDFTSAVAKAELDKWVTGYQYRGFKESI